ncbi:hypothetical protein LRB11_13200 [Ectothiorhodospira haloalkaliphila]|uniref:hypothetical protein n=1 Tax=Ectothiorhodospira haloalkaliphila TaxID=421628 RepID=UPI001EE8169A|nr:hypothetical protein [Ectothiorhodospira haloalkaliphila]MCG5525878.1 hypothetical protein [Ectothiorhodospira haloalkaliphila]
MPLGTKDTDPRDRKVIIIASRDELIDLAARAFESSVAGLTSPFSTRPSLFHPNLGFNLASMLMKGKMRKWSDDSLLNHLEAELKLGVPIALYQQSQASRLFRFGVGLTPKSGCIYIQHPILVNHYIPPEDFARTLSREKEAAFRQLASSLGAKELRLMSIEVQSKKGIFGGKVSLSKVASQVGIGIKLDKKGNITKRIYSRFGKPSSTPKIPADLAPWVERYPDLRTMARDRTEGHLLESHVTLEFKEGMGVAANIAAIVAGRGLTAGGSYEALHHSLWHFEVEYWPLR